MRIVIAFGQFGAAADPQNLPAFNQRLQDANVDTILIQHDETEKAINFLRGYRGFVGLVGASLGAMSVVAWARDLAPQEINFVGGFQPSDYDPTGISVNIEVQTQFGPDLINRAVEVSANVDRALCFRNPQFALTGGLGHAAYILAPGNTHTKLTTIPRLDAHPGDFGDAADAMFNAIMRGR